MLYKIFILAISLFSGSLMLSMEKNRAPHTEDHKIIALPAKLEYCAFCVKREMFKRYEKCSACKKSYYCSEVCQKADWPKHKSICKLARNVEKEHSVLKIENDAIANLINHGLEPNPLEGIAPDVIATIQELIKQYGIDKARIHLEEKVISATDQQAHLLHRNQLLSFEKYVASLTVPQWMQEEMDYPSPEEIADLEKELAEHPLAMYMYSMRQELIAAYKLNNKELFKKTASFVLEMLSYTEKQSPLIRQFQERFYYVYYFPKRFLRQTYTGEFSEGDNREHLGIKNVLEWTKEEATIFKNKGHTVAMEKSLEILRRKIIAFLIDQINLVKKTDGQWNMMNIFATIYELATKMACIKLDKEEAFIQAVDSEDVNKLILCLNFEPILKNLLTLDISFSKKKYVPKALDSKKWLLPMTLLDAEKIRIVLIESMNGRAKDFDRKHLDPLDLLGPNPFIGMAFLAWAFRSR